MARHLAVQIAAGALVGVGFGEVLAMLDVGGLGDLLTRSPEPSTRIIFMLGSALAFAPVVICTCFGHLSDDDAPADPAS